MAVQTGVHDVSSEFFPTTNSSQPYQAPLTDEQKLRIQKATFISSLVNTSIIDLLALREDALEHVFSIACLIEQNTLNNQTILSGRGLI